MSDLTNLLAAIGAIVAAVIAAPLLIWLVQGLGRPKRGGISGAFMDGVASAYQPEQVHTQEAKQKKKGGRGDAGGPPEAGRRA